MNRGFAPGHEVEDWLAAEAEVDAELLRVGKSCIGLPNIRTCRVCSQGGAQGVSLRRMAAPTSDVLALLEATFDAVVIMDDRGRISAFNRSAEEMFGYRAADALGRNVSMLMTCADRAAHDDHLQALPRAAASRASSAGDATCASGIATAANSRCS